MKMSDEPRNDIYAYIVRWADQYGDTPSVHQIADHFRMARTRVERLLAILKREGKIRRDTRMRSRKIRIVGRKNYASGEDVAKATRHSRLSEDERINRVVEAAKARESLGTVRMTITENGIKVITHANTWVTDKWNNR